jgi:hypothetical protein
MCSTAGKCYINLDLFRDLKKLLRGFMKRRPGLIILKYVFLFLVVAVMKFGVGVYKTSNKRQFH